MPAASPKASPYPAEDGAQQASPLALAEGAIKKMEDMSDYYFAADKEERMQKAATIVTNCVEPLLEARGGTRSQDLRARSLFLKGRALSLLGGQDRAAEELLTKAIKLDPKLVDAWNALGEAYWNVKDVAQAKKCFEQALELCGPNAVSLRNLSMALRAIDGDEQPVRRSENYAQALVKAKEAVQLGPGDPLNWETLGNAYVGDFFINAKRPDEISRALIAYEKADTAYEKMGKSNPTLHFNRAMAAKYVEEYDLALRSFQKAHELGANAAAEQGKGVFDLVQRLAGYVERKGDLKAKRLKELTEGFPSGKESNRTLRELQANENEDASIAARVLTVIDRKDEVPAILICCDRDGEFFAASFYNAQLQKLAESVVPMKSLLSISKANFRQVSMSAPNGKKWGYPCAVVGHPGDVSIVGGGSLAGAAVRSVVGFTTAAAAGAAGGAGADATDASAKPASLLVPSTASRDPVERFAECQRELIEAARAAAKAGRGKEAVIEALMPALRSLVDLEFENGGSRLARVRKMFERMARGDVFQEEHPDYGKRYAPGYVEGLTPVVPFREPEDYPWCAELKSHFKEIRDELRQHMVESGVWVPGAYAQSNMSYAPDWRIAGVLTADKWNDQTWTKTASVIRRLKGITPFEAFFARMPPHSSIAAHSDNLNYILTSHLALELEPDTCSIRVGNHERPWVEGEMLVFDTTYMHAAWNDSARNRYVLVVRYWHPGLSAEERRAIHMSHSLLAGTPDPDKLRGGEQESSMALE